MENNREPNRFTRLGRKKMLSMMRLAGFFCLLSIVCGVQVAHGQERRVSLEVKDTPINQVLRMLGKEFGKDFFYSNVQVDMNEKVNVKLVNATIDEALKQVFAGKQVRYEEKENFVLILEIREVKKDTKVPEVRGVVYDDLNEPLPGVTIMLKGTSTGFVSDADGKFKSALTMKLPITLVFSFIGFETQEVVVTDSTREVTVKMKPDVKQMEEVVVTGYANVKKSSFTGNAVRVDKEELFKVSPTNMIDVLQVFDPSLRIMKNNEMGADPNTLPEFYIRGRSGIGVMDLDKESLSESALSNNPNSPIFIMDGFEVTVQKVYDFDPNRIESITILKDAAATAIYGSRAANGVVVIETVAPKPGQLNVMYNFTGALTAPDLSDYNLMSAKELLEAERLAGYYEPTSNINSSYTLLSEYEAKLSNIIRGVNTDWLSQPLQNEFNHKHSLAIQGGSENMRFNVDLNYDNQNGVMKGSFRERLGAGFYLDYRIGGMQLKNQIAYMVTKSENSPYGNFNDYTKKLPYDELKDADGNYVEQTRLWHGGMSGTKNPLYEAKMLKSFDKSKIQDLTNNLSLNWYITKSLYFKGQVAVTLTDTETKIFKDPLSSSFYNVDDDKKGSLNLSKRKLVKWNTNFVLNYVQAIKKHNMNFSLGLNTNTESTNSSVEKYLGFPSGELNTPAFAENVDDVPTYSDNKKRLFGAFVSLNYTYNDIYLLDASWRLDGSSEFGADKKYAPFYSGGVGLNVHNYEFMKVQDVVSLLKITGTMGVLGKTNFPAYAAKHTYDVTNSYYSTGGGIYLHYMGNENLKWERTFSRDLKLELGFLNDAIYTKFTWYNKKTKDLITDVTIPTHTGFTSYKDNMGEVENKGFELDVRFNILQNKDWMVAVFGNLAHNRNKILKISESLKAYNERVNEKFDEYFDNVFSKQDLKYSKPLLKYEEGGSLTAIYGMRSLGINPSNGSELFLDRSGQVIQEWTSSQQSILGDTEPDATGSFGVNLQWKRFTLFATFMYEFGGQVYNQTLVDKVENVKLYETNADKRVLTERWAKPGELTRLKSIKDRNNVTLPTSRFVQDYNMLNFNSLTVGYDFDKDLLKKMRMSMLRLSFNMKDIFTISSVKQERGLSYPFARTFNLTLNASF
ncbi:MULTISPECIES: SusC/RagA family TonB-linked outer membrane protein [Butyricimonas]|uniref:SusC/RagA family TonB-linked outer membrane protein n=1 Tax=Butyricimonas TaxID=574697 RepID=UPI001D074C0E|nr:MULTISPECIES: SusC/RagA family TonB-linked outer membrane protein [Butyricimonas]MCB6973180.1 SusC/RagA family TonB-linked outer membrane protein [Butyricimonas synergistica]MCG4519902.1 SusC/RagA family TonB-linked outer membrane protein [Butyricimonas sp. DFI.6.44]